MRTRRVETGRVRIAKRVSEREERVDEPVWREEVEVERVPVNRAVDGPAPAARYEGDVMVVPVVEEVLVVKKQLVLKEELRVVRRRVREQHSQTVTLRREEAVVERGDPADQHGRGAPPRQERHVRKESHNGEDDCRPVREFYRRAERRTGARGPGVPA